jgi:hypothetical protein
MAANAIDLITIAQAYNQIQSQAPGGPYDALIQTLVTAASSAIEKWCRRDFYVRSYDELYNGNGDRRLFMRAYPIQTVTSVRYRPVTVMKVINNNSNNTQARVQITSTGITLTWTDNTAAKHTDTSTTFASYPTLAQAATQISTLSASGWSAQAVGETDEDYGIWPTADLYIPPSFGDGVTSQGALSARQIFAELKLHTYELAGFQFDPRGWLLRAIPYTDPELLHPEDLIFSTGIDNFRVQYTAGYTQIPQSVQQACAMWVATWFFEAQRDPNLKSQALAGSITQTWNAGAKGGPTSEIKELLQPYRRYTTGMGAA